MIQDNGAYGITFIFGNDYGNSNYGGNNLQFNAAGSISIDDVSTIVLQTAPNLCNAAACPP